MLMINCPFCGPRSEAEFAFGGPSVSRRPEKPDDLSDEDWVNYLTVVPNPMGPVRELWWHARGCGAWVELERDTVKHDIVTRPEYVK